ncbi:MAG: tetratricopeptide repeat protein [Verrucomicrobiota bacterium]|nr:tetratricopeptide repeat protein [Verrucomicrobiota bacterium]
MPNEPIESARLSRKKITYPFVPWLIAGGAFLIYLFTLNHWVTLNSLPVIAKMTGWDFSPTYIAPLYFLLTLPLKLLPTPWQPIGLNFFSALCATLTLGLLARSVTLLPHDRTRDQRTRTQSEFSLLSIRFAWLGPLLAALMCGLQLTFWENAIMASGEMLDLLLFAYVIRCLLEYRVSHQENWLTKFAFVYGLATTNNWAMIGFFPLFLAALLWIKGKSFFDFNFLARMTLVGLAGLSLYFLLPLVNNFSEFSDQTFWQMLKANLRFQKGFLFRLPFFQVPILRAHLFMMSLTSLLPILLISIRWPSFLGDQSPTGGMITQFMFRGLHLLFLAVGLWVFFDPKFSPRQLGFGMIPFLTFYYLTALSIGYFVGYVLLVFGHEPEKAWERSKSLARFFNRIVVVLLWVALIAVPAGLIYKNLKSIRANNSPALGDFARLTAQALPTKGAVILSDDPTQLLLIEAAFSRLGKKHEHLLLNTRALPFGIYHTSLFQHYPKYRAALGDQKFVPEIIDSPTLIQFLERLHTNHEIYYLQPSFGYYFERFYLRPRGLIYELKPYATNSISAPALTGPEIAENQKYWNQVKADIFPAIPAAATNVFDVALVKGYYSRALNYWGVELQKRRQLAEAGQKFSEALKLNPENVAAEINRQFNINLQKGIVRAVEPDVALEKNFAKYGSLEGNLSYNGPFDEIGFCSLIGQFFLQGGNYRQAGQQFLRVLDLSSNDFPARISLGKVYINLNQPDAALEIVKNIRAQQPEAAADPTNQFHIFTVESGAYLAKNDFSSAEKILLNARQKNPQDETFTELLLQFYFSSGHYTNALPILEQRLQTNSSDVNALLNKGFIFFQSKNYAQALTNFNRVSQLQPGNETALLQKSDLYIQTTNYDKAIAALDELLKIKPTQVVALIKKGATYIYAKQYKPAIAPLDKAIKLDPQNTAAFLNRAIAHLQLKEFAEAEKDYERVRKMAPKLYSVYYGLGEIAYQKKEKATALKHYKLYLDLAPRQTDEYKKISIRVNELQQKS